MPAAATASLLQRFLNRVLRRPTAQEGYRPSAPAGRHGHVDAHDRTEGPEEHEVDDRQLLLVARDGDGTVVALDPLPLAEANGMLARWANRNS